MIETSVFSSPTKNRNTYLLSGHSYLSFIHPALKEDSEDEYYRKKYQYLKSKGFFKDQECFNNLRINPHFVKDSIVNMTQLVFEVTDACNLKCKYCAYGEFYEDYDVRYSKKLRTEQVKPLFDYLSDLWENESAESYNKTTYISFYGGEPLLNMSFIKDVVGYINSLNIRGKLFRYTMTTNAVLLDKYMDYLAKHKFMILISLDGNSENNEYRVDFNGKNSFDRIIKNVDLLKKKYPDYFEKHVRFNSVLHNKNTVAGIYDFIHSKYSKIPSISELNNSGIRADKVAEFGRLYRSSESLYQEENYKEIERELFMNAYSYKDAVMFLHQYTGHVFKTYNGVLIDKKYKKTVPTGTCIPFSKKIFVTVNGKILPCERIGQQFSLGKISEEGVEIDYDAVAEKYNKYYDSLENQCSKCYRAPSCVQCLFYIHDIGNKPICHGFMDRSVFSKYIAANMTFWEEHAEDYQKVMDEVIIN
ncbi:MAG: radical SAM peptide maturase [Bacteroidales bacterium]|jgi:uncharacterized protein|nr:radical SAM peptide maturase [Bacteroidales bacterium]